MPFIFIAVLYCYIKLLCAKVKKEYYIKTNEIPGNILCENFISSHVKITCYLHM